MTSHDLDRASAWIAEHTFMGSTDRANCVQLIAHLMANTDSPFDMQGFRDTIYERDDGVQR